MRKFLLGVILLVGCVEKNAQPEPPPTVVTYQIRCPLTTIETTTDTVQATSFYYTDGALKFYKRVEPRRGVWIDQSKLVGQYPGTCVVKEIPN